VVAFLRTKARRHVLAILMIYIASSRAAFGEGGAPS